MAFHHGVTTELPPMTGILASGATVSVRRLAPEPHPLKHGTKAELQSTLITILQAAEVPMAMIAEVLNCSTRTCRRVIATTPPIKLQSPPRYADAGRW